MTIIESVRVAPSRPAISSVEPKIKTLLLPCSSIFSSCCWKIFSRLPWNILAPAIQALYRPNPISPATIRPKIIDIILTILRFLRLFFFFLICFEASSSIALKDPLISSITVDLPVDFFDTLASTLREGLVLAAVVLPL